MPVGRSIGAASPGPWRSAVRWRQRHGWRALPRLLRWWLPAWLLAEVVCAVFALQPWPAWIGTPERGLGLLDLGAWCLIVVAMSGVLVRFEFANRLHLGVLACSTLLALWLWAEWLTTSGSVHGQRPGGPLGNPLFAAGVLAMASILFAKRRIFSCACGKAEPSFAADCARSLGQWFRICVFL